MKREEGAGITFRRDLLSVLDGEARLAVLIVLQEWEGTVLYLPRASARERRVAVAKQLDGSGIRGAAAAAVLIERFHVSARTAWRDLRDCHRS